MNSAPGSDEKIGSLNAGTFAQCVRWRIVVLFTNSKTPEEYYGIDNCV